jgi:hypothetical protein
MSDRLVKSISGNEGLGRVRPCASKVMVGVDPRGVARVVLSCYRVFSTQEQQQHERHQQQTESGKRGCAMP